MGSIDQDREEPCLCIRATGQLGFDFQRLIKRGVAVLRVGLGCVVLTGYGEIGDSRPGV